MFWEEDNANQRPELPDDVVDLLFSIDCRELPVDHAYSLSRAIRDELPWLEDEARAAVHTIHVAGSQNGWERPAHDGDQLLILSRRTKLTLRVPVERLEDAARLTDRKLDLGGFPLKIGKSKTRPLTKQGTLFSRYVVCQAGEEEHDFLRRMATELAAMGIPMKKALCGKETALRTPDGLVHTRSLLLANLSLEHALLLQRLGLGPHRLMGCGIFLPHKGIDPVKKQGDD
jgi:CRISPR-associated protein Cas6